MINNVIEYLLESKKNYPDKVAFKDEHSQITFKELDWRARNIALAIKRADGLLKNKPIAVYMEKGVECLCAFMGIVYSGNFYSPIDIHTPKERVNTILNVLKPAIVLTNTDGKKQIEKVQLDIKDENMLLIDSIKDCTDDYIVEDMLKQHLDVNPLYILFTSGSTGIPKGVVISHRSVIDYTEWLTDTFKFNEHTVFGNQAPFYFDNSILDIYQTLKNGAMMKIIPEKLFWFHGELIKYMNHEKINTIFWVPSVLISMANSGVLEKGKIETLEKVLFCGEVMPTKQFNVWQKNYPQALFANLYGPTEITDVCSYYIVDREFEETESLPIGNACKNTEILVLNEKDELVKGEEPGELCVRGISLSLGYYASAQKTEEVFMQNPLNRHYRDLIYRTGDIVKYNERGELIYLCRKDSQIKYQGHRIELGEIDSAGYSIGGVRQACAVYDGTKIIFFCSISNDISEKVIYAELLKKIPKYMMPKVIKILDDIPLNANGKLDRVWLKEMAKQL